jgi:hypothetical protein
VSRARIVASFVVLAGVVVVATIGSIDAVAQRSIDSAPDRFATVDVMIESESPIAAWQFELTERTGSMIVVGVENGDSDVFGDAPYFDLDAVGRGEADRIIVADFSLSPPDQLPVGMSRIATVHVQLSGSAEPDYSLELINAGDADGRPIQATVRIGGQ